MNIFHFVLQNKGGIGKTYVAKNLSQYLINSDNYVYCFDIDNGNSSFLMTESLNVTRMDIVGDDNELDRDKIDNICHQITNTVNEQKNQMSEDDHRDIHCVMDIGATLFTSVQNYLFDLGFEILKSTNDDNMILIHTIIGGGDYSDVSLMGLDTIFDNINNCGDDSIKVVIWKNFHFGRGKFSFTGSNGTNVDSLEETLIFKENRDKVHGIINLDACMNKNYVKYIEFLNLHNLTYSDVLDDKTGKYTVLDKVYTKKIASSIFKSIREVDFEFKRDFNNDNAS